MIGEVILKNYQLYVRFNSGLVVILPNRETMNIPGSWRDFGLSGRIREDKNGRFTEYHHISGSSTPSFPTRELLDEFSTLYGDNDGENRYYFRTRYALSYNEIRNWMKDNGYTKGTCHDVLRGRYLKVKKLKQLIIDKRLV